MSKFPFYPLTATDQMRATRLATIGDSITARMWLGQSKRLLTPSIEFALRLTTSALLGAVSEDTTTPSALTNLFNHLQAVVGRVVWPKVVVTFVGLCSIPKRGHVDFVAKLRPLGDTLTA